jgi:hypothetical protein
MVGIYFFFLNWNGNETELCDDKMRCYIYICLYLPTFISNFSGAVC